MTTEQGQAMASAVPPYVHGLAVFAASTGMRQGELFGLTVDRVDFLRRTVRVDRQMASVSAGRPF